MLLGGGEGVEHLVCAENEGCFAHGVGVHYPGEAVAVSASRCQAVATTQKLVDHVACLGLGDVVGRRDAGSYLRAHACHE